MRFRSTYLPRAFKPFMQPRMGPPVGKSAFRLQEKQAVLTGQPQWGSGPAAPSQSTWEGHMMTRCGCSASCRRLLYSTSLAKEAQQYPPAPHPSLEMSHPQAQGDGERKPPPRIWAALDVVEEGPGPPSKTGDEDVDCPHPLVGWTHLGGSTAGGTPPR